MGARQADVRVWPKPPCFGQWFHSAIGSSSGSRELQWLGTDCVGQTVTEGLCGTNCYRRAGGGKGTHYKHLVVSVPPRPTPSWSVACTIVHLCEPCCVSEPPKERLCEDRTPKSNTNEYRIECYHSDDDDTPKHVSPPRVKPGFHHSNKTLCTRNTLPVVTPGSHH